MIILGIDPGTARMGYGLINYQGRGKITLLDSSTFITPQEFQMPKRLKMLFSNLKSLTKDFSPEVIVIEKLFFNRNVSTAINVGQARGVAMLVAAERKMSVFEYTALEAKKDITGYGRADKKEMQEAVKSILGLTQVIKSDDANDAVAMALCYAFKELR